MSLKVPPNPTQFGILWQQLSRVQSAAAPPGILERKEQSTFGVKAATLPAAKLRWKKQLAEPRGGCHYPQPQIPLEIKSSAINAAKWFVWEQRVGNREITNSRSNSLGGEITLSNSFIAHGQTSPLGINRQKGIILNRSLIPHSAQPTESFQIKAEVCSLFVGTLQWLYYYFFFLQMRQRFCT